MTDEKGVLGKLPRSRPGQRSDKRAASAGRPSQAATRAAEQAEAGGGAAAAPPKRAAAPKPRTAARDPRPPAVPPSPIPRLRPRAGRARTPSAPPPVRWEPGCGSVPGSPKKS